MSFAQEVLPYKSGFYVLWNYDSEEKTQETLLIMKKRHLENGETSRTLPKQILCCSYRAPKENRNSCVSSKIKRLVLLLTLTLS